MFSKHYYLIEEKDHGLDSMICLTVKKSDISVRVTATYMMPHNYDEDVITASYSPQNNRINWGFDFIIKYRGRGLGKIMMSELIEACQEIAPGAGSSKLEFTAKSHSDSSEENWERRDRFYRSAGFDIHYTPENKGSVGYAHIDDISRLKVNTDTKNFKKLSGVEVAEKLDRLISVNTELSSQQKNFEVVWKKQNDEIWDLMKKLYRLRFIKWLAAILAIASIVQLTGFSL